MPRYHFNVHDGTSQTDGDGIDLPDKEAAWDQAVQSTGEMLRDLGGRLRNPAELKMEVTDASGSTVFTLRLTSEEHGYA